MPIVEAMIARLRSQVAEMAAFVAETERDKNELGEIDVYGRKTTLTKYLLDHYKETLPKHREMIARHEAGEW
jgi:hypothetical protein